MTQAPSAQGGLRNSIFHVLFYDGDTPTPVQHFVNRAINLVIIISMALLVLERLEWFEAKYLGFAETFNTFALIIFTVEYFLRLVSGGLSKGKNGEPIGTLRYAFSPLALIDLLVILPFFITPFASIDLRVLRLVRVLRLFKLGHVLVPQWKHFTKINQDRTLRQKVYSILNDDKYSGEIHHTVDMALVTLICLSVTAVILESVHDIEIAYVRAFHIFDIISIVFFSAEYVLRLYSIPERDPSHSAFSNRLVFATSPSGLIDLLAILPFYISFLLPVDLRFLRVMRLLRILKLTRYSRAMKTVIEVCQEESPSLSAAFFVLALITVFSASLLYLVEHEAQPDKFSSIPQAMYWAIVTLTSIGYGDIYPVTPLGQALTMVMACVGLGMIALPTGILATGFTEKLRQQKAQFQELVAETAASGYISKEQQDELDREARALGLSAEREKKFESDEFSALGVVRTSETSDGMVLSFRSHETLEDIVNRIKELSPHDKSVVMAFLAVDFVDTRDDSKKS